MQRFRIEYSKVESLRYTGNLDMQKVWERYIRRAALPVAYSLGFHPQAKIQQACPLPLGFLSDAEIVDIWLDDSEITPEQVKCALEDTGQPGIRVKSVSVIPLYNPALQSLVDSAAYLVELHNSPILEEMDAQVQRVLTADSLMRQRREKQYDLRPLIQALTLHVSEDRRCPILEMRLAAREGATGRPDEVLAELGLDLAHARIIRTALFFR